MDALKNQPLPDSPSARGRPRVLVADDQPDVVEALELLLRGEGFEVDAAHSPKAVLEALDQRGYDVLLVDLNYTRDTTSGQEGLDLLAAIRRRDAQLPVVVMSAWTTVQLAVAAVQAGAADFIEKPWKNQRLVSVLRNQAALGAAVREGERLRADRRRRDDEDFEPIVAASPAMRQVVQLIDQVARSDAFVLLTGDNGTGKGLLARHLHRASARGAGPFVAVNTGAIAAGLFESEMFGHAKGAFTDARSERIGRFELADGGTLFLDEIGDLPLDQQAKLLHVLDGGRFERVGETRSREADVRVVAATNRDLARAVADGAFRKDLFFRINTVQIHIPPLADRRDDIAPLANFFLERHGARYGRRGVRFSAAALQVLEDYPWPGNVRELGHIVERAVLLAQGEEILPENLLLQSVAGAASADVPLMPLAEAEKRLIRAALQRFRGDVAAAAAFLGVSRSALYRRLEKHGLGN